MQWSGGGVNVASLSAQTVCMQGREEKPVSCCLKQSKHHKNKNADFGGGDQCLSNLLCGTQGLLSKGRKIPQGLGWGGWSGRTQCWFPAAPSLPSIGHPWSCRAQAGRLGNSQGMLIPVGAGTPGVVKAEKSIVAH